MIYILCRRVIVQHKKGTTLRIYGFCPTGLLEAVRQNYLSWLLETKLNGT